jgi:hypothetical protein
MAPNGRRLASAGSDGIVQFYALDTHDLLDLARSRVTRDFIPEECRAVFQHDNLPKRSVLVLCALNSADPQFTSSRRDTDGVSRDSNGKCSKYVINVISPKERAFVY